MSKEPIAIAIMVAYLISQGLGLIGITTPPTIAEAGAEFFLFLIGALIARSNVFSKATIIQAGYSPYAIVKKADAVKNIGKL